MTTLTITLDEKHLRQITEEAQGTDANTIAVNILQQAFGEVAQETPDAPEQSAGGKPTAEQFLAFLAPVWAQQCRSSAAKASTPGAEAEDIYEAKLAQYVAEDYDRAQRRRQ